jgi:hypothetical protein
VNILKLELIQELCTAPILFVPVIQPSLAPNLRDGRPADHSGKIFFPMCNVTIWVVHGHPDDEGSSRWFRIDMGPRRVRSSATLA